jgi:hypothetical protein
MFSGMQFIIVGCLTADCLSGSIVPMSRLFIQMSNIFAEPELSILRARGKQLDSVCIYKNDAIRKSQSLCLERLALCVIGF